MSTRIWRIGFCVHFGAIIVVSAIAYAGGLPNAIAMVPYADKVLHTLGAGLLALLLDGALAFRGLVPKRRFPPLASILVLALCGIEEILQGFSVHRTSSFADFAADVLGVTLAYFFLAALARTALMASSSASATSAVTPSPRAH